MWRLHISEVAMSDREPLYDEPESCLCPTCRRVMRLTRVPALKDLNSSQYFFNCRTCDYTSHEVSAVSPDFLCDVRGEADFEQVPFDPIARCEHELAEFARAVGARLPQRQ
jgi:hypothetical protein